MERSYGSAGQSNFDHFSVPPPNYQQISLRNSTYNEPPPSYNKNDGYESVHRNSSGNNWCDRFSGGYGNGSGNKDNYNKGSNISSGGNTSGGDMITQEDTIFVSGMDPSATELDIETHFGAIGIIKKDKRTLKPKIWLYKHKDTGISKGEATVTYDDINAAQSAIEWFDGRDFNGCVIKVSLAQRQNNWNKGGQRSAGRSRVGNSGSDRNDRGSRYDRHSGGDFDSRSGGRGGRFTGGGSNNNVQPRDGDWKCSSCNNTNFAWRYECNRCKTPKNDSGGEVAGSVTNSASNINYTSNNDCRYSSNANERGSGYSGGHSNRERRNNVGSNSGYTRYDNDNNVRGNIRGLRRDSGGPKRNDIGSRPRPY